MKKFVSLMIFSLLLLPLTVSGIVRAENSNQNVTMQATHDVHVRSNPSMGRNIIGVLKKGESIQVKVPESGVLGGWCQVDYKDYAKAYIACRFLETTTLKTQATDQSTVTMYVKPHALNVRSTASLGRNVIGHLKKGDAVQVSATNGLIRGPWCKINHEGKTAYVSCYYLSKQQPELKAQQKPAEQTTGGPTSTQATATGNEIPVTMTVKPSALNVRSAPKMGNNVIDHVKKGDTVDVLLTKEQIARLGWCKIKHNDGIGYVGCRYLGE